MIERPRAREAVAVFAAAVALAVIETYPIAFRMGSVGRLDSGDGRFGIWNVAWVAHALTTNPARLWNANIFYPHRGALAYSEANVGAGVLAAPAYWATQNPYFAHNFAVLLAFTLSAVGTYFLVRRLTGQRGAAAVAAVAYAYCPFVFARTAEIQLMMTWGLPFVALAFHRLVERQTPLRALALGFALAAQALSCGYYGIFAALFAGLATIYFAVSDRLWRRRDYWLGIGVAALFAIALVGPFFQRYVELKRDTGFARGMEDMVRYSATWRAYLASPARSHEWLLRLIEHWNEVLFPGFLPLFAAAFAVWRMVRPGSHSAGPFAVARRVVAFYVLTVAFALWMSYGPDAGLYMLFYKYIPVFTFLRAPARFGIVVAFGVAVLAGIGVREATRRLKHPDRIAGIFAALVVVELTTAPLPVVDVPPVPAAYRLLAKLPQRPVAEFPFFFGRLEYHRHTSYMLASTAHWHPLINGYSDYIPPDFRRNALPLSTFPSTEAFRILNRSQVKYVVFHTNHFDGPSLVRLQDRIDQYSAYLKPMLVKDEVWLYEIVDWPDLSY